MKYKKIMMFLVLVISLLYIFNFYLTTKEAYVDDIKDEIIRFHVKANSDDKEDQELKLKVRDKILEETQHILSESKTIDDTRAIIMDNLDNIKLLAEEVIKDEGKNYDVDVTLAVESFPTRKYGNVVFPAGDYETLMVKIGKGQGKNWWCVMFPPLCFVDMASSTAVNVEEELLKFLPEDEVHMLLSEKEPPIILKSKIVEIFEKTKDYLAEHLAELN